MVVIRLSRAGAKKAPFYSIEVKDKRSRRDGRFIEKVGYYNPVARGAEQPLQLNMDRINYWLGEGAQLSDRVSTLVKGFVAGDESLTTSGQRRSDYKLAQQQAAKLAQEQVIAAQGAEETASEEADTE